ncbi:NAD(P)H-dependent glycerol-3-phosphate dehydrogenase [Olsenella sp. YH-ols2223]|uniref:Glycerol-3-phosphate dehydrogenase [NAD(P)+] n=1 Tax=Olsenella absiana TaxID=3115222 RepID=A0ABU7R9M8_9ACTN
MSAREEGSPRLARVSVVGTGSWGTAATGLVAPKAEKVVLWGRSPEACEAINRTRHNPRHLTGYELARNVSATADLAEAASGADALVLALPSAYLRATARSLAPYAGATTPVLVLTKGVEPGTGDLMSDVVAEELGRPGRVAALSGPNHAEEICQGSYAAAVVASAEAGCATFFQRLMGSHDFRVYASADLTGVEVSGAVKNVVAIACGVAAGLGAGDNTLAALMTRGIAEMSRVVAALGGDPMTCMGLAGMGDLVATCTSRHSRNRTFGEAFAAGESLESYQSRTHMVVEGAAAARSVYELAQKHAIEAPITCVVHAILYEGLPLAEAIESLLQRRVREEFYGLGTNE